MLYQRLFHNKKKRSHHLLISSFSLLHLQMWRLLSSLLYSTIIRNYIFCFSSLNIWSLVLFRCRKRELNFNDQSDALIMLCLHFSFPDHAPLPLSLLFVCLSARFPPLIYASLYTNPNTHKTYLYSLSFYLNSLQQHFPASTSLVCFSGITMTSLFFSLHLPLSQNQASGISINRGFPTWDTNILLLGFPLVLLAENSRVPDARRFSLFSPL